MSLTRLLAVARKEVVQILRDSRSLIIVVIMPVTLMLLFGYGVNLDLKGLPVYVYDRDGSQQSQDLLKHFQASEYFHVARVVQRLSGADPGARRRPRQDGDRDSVGFLAAACATAARLRFRRSSMPPTTTRPTCSSAMRRRWCRATRRRFNSSWLRQRGQSLQPAPVSVRNPHLVQRES